MFNFGGWYYFNASMLFNIWRDMIGNIYKKDLKRLKIQKQFGKDLFTAKLWGDNSKPVIISITLNELNNLEKIL